jgi:hypothetical protein
MERFSTPTFGAQPEVSNSEVASDISAQDLGAFPDEGARANMFAVAFALLGLFAEPEASPSSKGELVPSTGEPTLRHYAVQLALLLPACMGEAVAAMERFELLVTVYFVIGLAPSRCAEDIQKVW